MANAGNCGSCQWWDKHPNDTIVGRCLRYPPRHVQYGTHWTGRADMGIQPLTHLNDRCGEWRQIEPDGAAKA